MFCSNALNSLKSETIELLNCLKSWFRLSILMEEDLHATFDTLQDDRAMEVLEEALDQYSGPSGALPEFDSKALD